MQQADRKPFAAALAATFGVYGQTITPDVIRIWWNVLDGYRLDAVLSALSYHVADHEGHGYRLPTPADVRRHLEVTLPRLAAEEARPIVEAHRERIRVIDEQIMRLKADVRLGLIEHSVAAAHANVLANKAREAREDPAYQQALAGPKIRDEEKAPAEPRGWLPPFLRRGIALLTGRTE